MTRNENGVVKNSFYSQADDLKKNKAISAQYLKESNIDSDIRLYDYEIKDNKVTIVKLY